MSTPPATPPRSIPILPAARTEPDEFVSLYAKQPKIYPRSVSGWFARWRWTMVWLTQLVFYGLPWATWNGQPAMLFDLDAREFHVLGLTMFPQDFIYLTALLVLAALALFFFTAVAGRLWCGYACPQTVYTEIFLWVERRLEGDRLARMRLDQAAPGAEKLLRKGAKHTVWLALSLFTGFSFVGYFTPIRTLGAQMLSLSMGPGDLFWVLFYGLATYGNAGWLREQVCKYMCPYARFQSALIDKDSLIITYDAGRGDPRGSRRRGSDAKAQGLGDCIDCTLCVQVCPTGIDIREGLQNECIGCAACIDVCNDVMDKMGSPQGLIRYATENGVAGGWTRARMLRRVLRPRVLVYGAVLLSVSAAFAASVAMRRPFHVDVLKDRNVLARQVEDGRIENVYRLQLHNDSGVARRYNVRASGIAGLQLAGAAQLSLLSGQTGTLPLRLQLPAEAATPLRGQVTPIQFEIEAQAEAGAVRAVVHEKSTFVVPR
ncbi:MAG: cytochrome c oxidase accessory protein CcoG [Ideonella sp.]|nr:cytochrome c oxidase accessory protein CcoG [Ideonella sp.]